MDNRLFTIITYVFVGVWVVMVAVTLIDRTYSVPSYVQALITAIAVYMYARETLKRKNGKNGDDKPK
jgi:hypothetical protein